MGCGASVPGARDEAQERAGGRQSQEAVDAKKDADGKPTKTESEAAEVEATSSAMTLPVARTSISVTLPATLDEVDADFVATALRCGGYVEPGTRIASFEKVKYGREKGYLGDKCLLRDVVYADGAAEGAPRSIFVKLFPTDLVIPAAACAGMWRTEVDFVTRMLKQLPDASGFRVPRFFFAERRDAEEEGKPPRFVILMEAIESARPCDILTSMPVEHALRAARDLATLHAPYWGWSHTRCRENAALEGYGHMEDAGKKEGLQGMFKTGSGMGLMVFGADGPLSAAQREDFSGYVEFWRFFDADIWPLLQKRWGAVLDRWSRIPTALIHGDCHVENMLCLADGSNIYIDFQAANLGPGVRDLAWLLTSSLKAEERREHEEAIVRAYHEALLPRLGDGARGYAWEQCWEDFVFMKIHGLWAAMLGAGLFAGKNFKEKAGIFAAEPSDDALLERRRNNVLFSRVVDDMRHSSWPAMLQALPEDGGDTQEGAPTAEGPGAVS